MFQIIYSSESSTPMQLDDLEDILEHARASNAAKGITGALVYVDGMFLQILEGNRVKVQQLMVKILRDLRHEAVKVLQEREIAAPVFSGWQMAYVSATPQQVVEWAGLGSAVGAEAVFDHIGRDTEKSALFTQRIFSLLAPGASAQTPSG